MIKLTLARDYTNSSGDMPYGTRGVLSGENFSVHTLELPWSNNEPNVSCIPAGVYVLLWHARGYLIVGGSCVASEGDLGPYAKRFGCLFHIANYPWEIQGCIAPGTATGVAPFHQNSERQACCVWNSRDALATMRDYIGTTPAQLTIEWE